MLLASRTQRWLLHSKKTKNKYITGYPTRVCERLDVVRQVDVKKLGPLHFLEFDTNDPHCAQLWPVHKHHKKAKSSNMLRNFSAVKLIYRTHVLLLSLGPGNDCGFTCARVMNSFFSRLPTKIRILDSTRPTLLEIGSLKVGT